MRVPLMPIWQLHTGPGGLCAHTDSSSHALLISRALHRSFIWSSPSCFIAPASAKDLPPGPANAARHVTTCL